MRHVPAGGGAAGTSLVVSTRAHVIEGGSAWSGVSGVSGVVGGSGVVGDCGWLAGHPASAITAATTVALT
jgi:hypothetical protein